MPTAKSFKRTSFKKGAFKSKYVDRRKAGRIPRPIRSNNSMQSAELNGIRMKFTTVFDLNAVLGFDSANTTICMLGQRVTAVSPGGQPIDLGNVNPDGKTGNYFALFQQYCITGVQVKLMFPEPGALALTSLPVQWAMAYSPEEIINSGVSAARLQSLSSY